MLKTLDLNKVMVIDIETVPQYASFDDVPLHFQDLWAQKTQHQRKPEQSPDDFYKKAGIMAEFGQIICISFGIFYEQNNIQYLGIKSIYGEDENKILKDFSKLLPSKYLHKCLVHKTVKSLITHNYVAEC